MHNLILIILFFASLSANLGAKTISQQIRDDGINAVVDFSPIINKQLYTDKICDANYRPTRFNKSGIPVKMLGMASVFMGPGPGSSKYGHAGVRIVYCMGNNMMDMYFDGIKLIKESLDIVLEDDPNIDPVYLNSKKVVDSLYYRKIQNPTQLAVYGLDVSQINRNIYEQWLDLREDEIFEILLLNIKRIEKQKKQIASKEKLPKFKGLLNNCTYQVTEDLQSLPRMNNILILKENNSLTHVNEYSTLYESLNLVRPQAIYQAIEEANLTKLLVIYPSIDNMRKIYFQKLNQNEAIDLLEVPSFSFTPRPGTPWPEHEVNQVKNELESYVSPLSLYFKRQISR